MLNSGNLTAIASAFSDHPYASTPGNSTPVRVERKPVPTAIEREVDSSVGNELNSYSFIMLLSPSFLDTNFTETIRSFLSPGLKKFIVTSIKLSYISALGPAG